MSRHGLFLLACAWVLWEQITFKDASGHGSKWHMIYAHPAREECAARFNQAVQDRAKRLGPKAKINGGSVAHRDADGIYIYDYLCLPDTIDPRKSN